MVPTAKAAPELRVDVNVVTAQLSVAVGAVQVATCVQVAGLAPFDVNTMFEGQPAITGLLLSVTVTVNVQVVTLLCTSVAV